MRDVDELRHLTAGRLLAIWRQYGDAAEDPMERALLCNAAVLAESCFSQGEPVFAGAEDVLNTLTTREIETLLRQLAARGETTPRAVENPAFDPARFLALQEG